MEQDKNSLIEELYDDSKTLVITRETASNILDIDDSTMFKHLRAGIVAGAFKLGGGWFIYKKGLREFLEGTLVCNKCKSEMKHG